MIKQDNKIDMVYLWCEGNDPAFKKRKQQYLKLEDNSEQENNEAVGDIRFFDNEELKYSLRSLEMYGVCPKSCGMRSNVCVVGLQQFLWFRYGKSCGSATTLVWFRYNEFCGIW